MSRADFFFHGWGLTLPLLLDEDSVIMLIQYLSVKACPGENGLSYCSDTLECTGFTCDDFKWTLLQIILTFGLPHPIEKSTPSCVSEPLLLRALLLLLCAPPIAPHSNKTEQPRLRASPRQSRGREAPMAPVSAACHAVFVRRGLSPTSGPLGVPPAL